MFGDGVYYAHEYHEVEEECHSKWSNNTGIQGIRPSRKTSSQKGEGRNIYITVVGVRRVYIIIVSTGM